MEHGGHKNFHNKGCGIRGHWNAVGDSKDDNRHGEERFYDKRDSLAEFRGERKGKNREGSNDHTRDDDVEEKEERYATDVDVECDIGVRFGTAAEGGEKTKAKSVSKTDTGIVLEDLMSSFRAIMFPVAPMTKEK